MYFRQSHIFHDHDRTYHLISRGDDRLQSLIQSITCIELLFTRRSGYVPISADVVNVTIEIRRRTFAKSKRYKYVRNVCNVVTRQHLL